MFESYPENEENYLPLLMLSSEGEMSIITHLDALESGDYTGDTLEQFLENIDPQMYETMLELIEGWGFDESDGEAFCRGFSLTYTALAFQAELVDQTLPTLEEPIAEGFIGNLIMLQNDTNAYCQDAAVFLSKHNYNLVSVWEDYVGEHRTEMTDDERFSFVIGGIMAHDILRDQINASHMLLTYQSSEN